MQLSDWKREGKTFSFEGHRIFYRDEGAGDVLLCLHGFPTSSWDWARLWPQLTQRLRVVAPDLLGYGFSGKPPGHVYSVLEQATLTERLMESLGYPMVEAPQAVLEALLAFTDSAARQAG